MGDPFGGGGQRGGGLKDRVKNFVLQVFIVGKVNDAPAAAAAAATDVIANANAANANAVLTPLLQNDCVLVVGCVISPQCARGFLVAAHAFFRVRVTTGTITVIAIVVVVVGRLRVLLRLQPAPSGVL